MAGTATISWISIITTDITFDVVTNWQESPANVWGPVTGNTGEGESPQSLGASTDGWIQMDIDTDTLNVVLLFDTSNALASPYYNGLFGLYTENGTGNYKVHSSAGFVDLGIAFATGDKCRVKRTGSTVIAEYYRGGSWTFLYTYPDATSAALYIYGSQGDIGIPQYMRNPIGYNIS